MIRDILKKSMGARSLQRPVAHTLKWLFVDSAMRKRVLVTVGVMIALKFIALIPLPGINMSALQEFFRRISGTQSGSLMSMAQQVSSRAFDRLRIFPLGLMPFFSSCLLLQLASIIVPKLRKYSFGGEAGRKKIATFTYILTMILSGIQAYFLALWIENPARFGGLQLVANPGLGFRLLTTAAITASVFFLLFIGDLINKHGIGNGVAIIAVSSFFPNVLEGANAIILSTRNGEISRGSFLFFIVIFAGLTYVIFYLTNRASFIDMQDDTHRKSVLSVRNSIVGQVPLQMAVPLIMVPLTLAVSFHSSWGEQRLAFLGHKSSTLYTIIFTVVVAVITYLYVLIVFNSKRLSGLVNKYGFSLVSINNESPEDRLDNCMSNVLITTVLVLSAIHLIPSLAGALLKVPYWETSLFYGATILVGIGVFTDILHQVELFKSKSDSGIKDWSVCYTAFDEFEGKIKAEFLKNKDIQALIEPLRFTWGMPVRTMVDQYKLYVPCDKKDEARNLLLS